MQIRYGTESGREISGVACSGHRLTLVALKTAHTLIWIVMTAANFAGFFLALAGRFNRWFFLCVALLGGETAVILANSWHCPLTDVMSKYTPDRAANFDIYLPEWLARNNIRIFSVLIALEILAVFWARR
jgi:hypothetical protein